MVLNQTPRIAVPQIGTQYLITMKEWDQKGEHLFEKKMNCLPEQLMALFYGVSS